MGPAGRRGFEGATSGRKTAITPIRRGIAHAVTRTACGRLDLEPEIVPSYVGRPSSPHTSKVPLGVSSKREASTICKARSPEPGTRLSASLRTRPTLGGSVLLISFRVGTMWASGHVGKQSTGAKGASRQGASRALDLPGISVSPFPGRAKPAPEIGQKYRRIRRLEGGFDPILSYSDAKPETQRVTNGWRPELLNVRLFGRRNRLSHLSLNRSFFQC